MTYNEVHTEAERLGDAENPDGFRPSAVAVDARPCPTLNAVRTFYYRYAEP
jgi:hypothetical protein